MNNAKMILVFLVGFGSSMLAARSASGGESDGVCEVGIFADPQGTDCNLQDVVPGLCSYHVVVDAGATGMTAVEFSAPQPPCMLAVFLSDTAVYPVTIGTSQSGVAIGFGACLTGKIHVLTINYFCQALTSPCCEYPVLPDPNVPSGTIEFVDCSNNLQTGLTSLNRAYPKTFVGEVRMNIHDVKTHGRAVELACRTDS